MGRENVLMHATTSQRALAFARDSNLSIILSSYSISRGDLSFVEGDIHRIPT